MSATHYYISHLIVVGWFLKSRQAYQQQQQKIPTKLFVLPSGVKKLNGAKGDKFLLVSLLLLLLQYGLLFFGCFCLVIENYKGTYLRVYVCDYKANNIVATDIILPVFRWCSFKGYQKLRVNKGRHGGSESLGYLILEEKKNAINDLRMSVSEFQISAC